MWAPPYALAMRKMENHNIQNWRVRKACLKVIPASSPVAVERVAGRSSASGSRKNAKVAGSAISKGKSATIGNIARHPKLSLLHTASCGTMKAAALVPTSMMPKASPRCLTNQRLNPRLQVTGVDPMPIIPTSNHRK
jgi:hypothetical protein